MKNSRIELGAEKDGTAYPQKPRSDSQMAGWNRRRGTAILSEVAF
jgi:hypothetical protein